MLPPELASKIDDLMRVDLEYWADWWFRFLKVSTALVVIGVVFEGPEVFHVGVSVFRHWWHVIVNWWQTKRRLTDFCGWDEVCPELNVIARPNESRTPNWIAVMGLIGWMLVVFGVAGEGIAETVLADADSNLRSFNNALLTEARKETALALERSAETRLETAKLRTEAARLTELAEHERLLRIQLEGEVVWRRLSKVDQTIIGIHLRPFLRENAFVSYEFDSADAKSFATDIALGLQGAKWNVAPPSFILISAVPKFGNPIAPIVTGVGISTTGDDFSVRAGKALCDELDRLGFDVSPPVIAPDQNPSAIVVRVTVHGRPEGPQGEATLKNQHKQASCLTNP
jgi:hypothetical protein